MKNVIIIIILFISNIVFSQYEINAEQVPSFNRIDKESNHTTALNSLNHNIQDLKLLQTINKSTQFENGPILSSCNKLKTNQQKLLCTKKKIIQIVGRNLNDEFSKKHKLNGSHRVFAYFDVNKKAKLKT